MELSMLTELNSTDKMMFYKDSRRQKFLYVVFVSALLPLLYNKRSVSQIVLPTRHGHVCAE